MPEGPAGSPPPGDGGPALAVLREQAAELVGALPGRLRRIRVRSGDIDIEVEWQPAEAVAGAPAANGDLAAASHPNGHAGEHPFVVSSPMVGTFYHAAEPGADPFVAPGDLVDEDQVVGIVEAMKLMNPVTAGVSGRVVEVLAGNAEPVEFGQPLVAVLLAT